jgi:hypothetical protein
MFINATFSKLRLAQGFKPFLEALGSIAKV